MWISILRWPNGDFSTLPRAYGSTNLALSNKKQRDSFWPKTLADGRGKEVWLQTAQGFFNINCIHRFEKTDFAQTKCERDICMIRLPSTIAVRNYPEDKYKPTKHHNRHLLGRAGVPGFFYGHAEPIGKGFCWIWELIEEYWRALASPLLGNFTFQPSTKESIQHAPQT